MAVLRVNKTKNYSVMSNFHLRDKTLSLKGKGLLSVMLSLPDDWDYSINGLVSISKENKTSIRSAIKELEEHGYVKRSRVQDYSGKFNYVYDIYEKPCTENLHTDNLYTDNQPQLNTNESSTKQLSTKDNIYNACFESFWKQYPRKKEKAKAYKCYQARLKDGYSEQELLSACINYAKECEEKRTEERYIKLGATFLGCNTPFTDYLKGDEENAEPENRRPASDYYRQFLRNGNGQELLSSN